MEVRALMELKPNLEEFLKEFDFCIPRPESRRHLRTYVSGQVSSLERKSVEPIALAADMAPRTLEEFLSIHRWDEDKVAKRVREIVARDHADAEAVGVIDGTSFFKRGEKTVGVKPQYCGETGRVSHCVVTVNLGYVAGEFHCLLGTDLYLSEDWVMDRKRSREARIPEEVEYRPKWQMALDLVDQALKDRVRFSWLTADEEYGRSIDFRHGVSQRGIHWVVEVPRDLHGFVKGTQRARKAPRVEELWRRGGPSWAYFYVKDTQKGPLVWQARLARFFPFEHGAARREHWLMVARNPLTGERKYFLSDAPADTKPEALLRVALMRWHVERLFQDGKGEVGMGHFEVRRYPSVKRHFILSVLSFLFLARETEKLAKKTGSVVVSGEESGGGAIGGAIIVRAKAKEIEKVCAGLYLSG